MEENEREDFGIIMAAILTLLGLIRTGSWSQTIKDRTLPTAQKL
jgi:hypothetical protein